MSHTYLCRSVARNRYHLPPNLSLIVSLSLPLVSCISTGIHEALCVRWRRISRWTSRRVRLWYVCFVTNWANIVHAARRVARKHLRVLLSHRNEQRYQRRYPDPRTVDGAAFDDVVSRRRANVVNALVVKGWGNGWVGDEGGWRVSRVSGERYNRWDDGFSFVLQVEV